MLLFLKQRTYRSLEAFVLIQSFSKILTLAEYEKDKFKCPKCHGNKVEQRLSPVYAVRNTSTSKGHDQMYLKNP